MSTSATNKKIAVITLGCAKNTVDSESLIRQLQANNLDMTSDPREARIAIVNTCGFIDEAKRQSIETILETIKLKHQGKLEQVYVMGCLSERYRTELEKELPEVDFFFGTSAQPALLRRLGGEYNYALLGERILTTPHYMAYLKISEGCDNPCSFCAIPIMRGTHRSKPIEVIMQEVVSLASQGVRELIMIGQDTTYYGLDVYGKRKLASLLEALSTIKEFEWIRLMYTYPAKFPIEILEVMARHPNICHYIDMPIQHAADSVLKSMRRGITRRATEELVNQIRSVLPDVTLRTTIITGYPTERDEDVDELIEFLSLVRFDRVGVFPYSQEDGTPAYDMGDPVPQEVKEARKARIMEYQQAISIEKNAALIGSTMKVLIEREENGYWIGRSERDAPEIDGEVFVAAAPDTPCKIGEFAPVTITNADEYDLHGTFQHFPGMDK